MDSNDNNYPKDKDGFIKPINVSYKNSSQTNNDNNNQNTEYKIQITNSSDIPIGNDLSKMMNSNKNNNTNNNSNIKLSNNGIYKKNEEIEYGKKSHLEYLKFIQSNKDPLMVQAKGGFKDYTIEEVKKHNKEDDLWMVVDGKVFDLTKYLDYHPGGAKKLMKGAGKDGTSLFNKYHPWVNLMALVGKLQIGFLKN